MIPGSVNPLLVGKKEYRVLNSLRFRASNNAKLTRTPSSASNRRTYTWSAWIKRGTLSSNQHLFGVNAVSDYQSFRFNTSDILQLYLQVSTLSYGVEVAAPVWRDPSAWYHIVLAVDTTQSTQANRIKIYVNSVEQTVTAMSGLSFPAQNFDTYVNAVLSQDIGIFTYIDTLQFDGYMAEINFVDGQQLTPSSFGQTDSATGVWIAKKYAGTYGTNGYYLKFADASAATAAAIGKDSSGNGNNWTPSGISVTSGVTFDQMTDTPTLNYCVLNPLSKSVSGGSLKNANMTWNSGGGGLIYYLVQSTFVLSGKCYWECVVPATLTYHRPGIMRADQSPPSSGGSYFPGGSLGPANSVGYVSNDGDVYVGGAVVVAGATPSAGDILQFAFDAATGKFWVGRNGTYLNSGDPAAGTGSVTTVSLSYNWVAVMCDATTQDNEVNFGQRAFAYTAPSGFKALNSTNLPTPTIKKANTYFDVVTYTGNGSTSNVSITGLKFSPDLIWFKRRDSSTNGDHVIIDSSRLSQLTSANTFISNTGLNFAGDTGNWVWGIDASGTGIKGPIGGTLGTNVRTGIYYDVDIDANTPFEVEYQLRGTDSANSAGLIAIYRKEDQGNVGTVSNRFNLGMFSLSSTHWVNGIDPAPTVGIGVQHSLTSAEVIEEVSANAVLLTSNVATTNVFVLAREADGNLRMYRTNASGTRVLVKTHPEKTNSIMRVALSCSAEGNNLGLQYLKINLVNVTSTAGRYASLYPNLTTFDKIEEEFVSFNSRDAMHGAVNGFTIKNNGINAAADGSRITSRLNINAATMVSWLWKKNPVSGFDIVTYTGSGANANISHSLGVAPSMLIVKQRASNTATNWAVWHTGIANTNYLLLNSSAASATGATYWNSITPNSSTFSVGTHLDVNFNNGRYVAYLWSQVEGFSRIGSYTGNGSTDGPFVFCNFRPKLVMIKSAGVENWAVQDSARNPFNVVNARLKPNSADIEAASSVLNIDFLSNGFKIRNTDPEKNSSGTTYIFAAYAENPFKYARAR